MKFTINSEPAGYQNIHCAILTGMPETILQQQVKVMSRLSDTDVLKHVDTIVDI